MGNVTLLGHRAILVQPAIEIQIILAAAPAKDGGIGWIFDYTGKYFGGAAGSRNPIWRAINAAIVIQRLPVIRRRTSILLRIAIQLKQAQIANRKGLSWPRITSYNVCYTKLLRKWKSAS